MEIPEKLKQRHSPSQTTVLSTNTWQQLSNSISTAHIPTRQQSTMLFWLATDCLLSMQIWRCRQDLSAAIIPIILCLEHENNFLIALHMH